RRARPAPTVALPPHPSSAGRARRAAADPLNPRPSPPDERFRRGNEAAPLGPTLVEGAFARLRQHVVAATRAARRVDPTPPDQAVALEPPQRRIDGPLRQV